MKPYIREKIKDLVNSDAKKTTIKLKDNKDYKKNSIRLLYNKFILETQKKIIPSHFKNWLLRTTGMKVGYDVCLPHEITFDPYFPELITLDDGCLIGGYCTFITHEVKGKTLTLGKNYVSPRVLIGGMTKFNPGTAVGEKAMVMFFSELKEDVPKEELWGGFPAKKIKKFSDEEIEKFNAPSKRKKGYYKEFKKKVSDFIKDPNKTFFKMHYDGKRLNAGDDWWRARNVIRIFYNAFFIEAGKFLPPSKFKNMFYRMAGVKIGKNCRIAKGVIFDHIYCDLITLEDNVRLDENCYLDGHEYTITQTIFGKTTLKKGVHMKHDSYVRTGTTIGENTTIEPNSFCQKEVPANVVFKGNKVIREK